MCRGPLLCYNACAMKWGLFRRISQLTSLAAFLCLAMLTVPRFASRIPLDFFFRLDPLAAGIAWLSARRWMPAFSLALVLLLSALALGRAWCGWICPLGTILDLVGGRRPFGGRPWRLVKYILLGVALGLAGAGLSTGALLDPMGLALRGFAAFPRLWGKAKLPAAVVLLGPLLAVLALNAVTPRFWCRFLCPLGALLGVLARFSWVPLQAREAGEACVSCGLCERLCPAGAITLRPSVRIKPSECILCLRCYEECPRRAIVFAPAPSRPSPPVRVSGEGRREFLALALAGVGALLLGVQGFSRNRPRRLRPPGATEASLLARCIRCGECIKVCPTGALWPDPTASPGMGQPVLVPRLGYCSYNCNACGLVCPTSAILPLSLDEKRLVVIGKAVVDSARCLAWRGERLCDVCYKTCPYPHKALEMIKVELENPLGEKVPFRVPQVIESLCTGCGICEYNCPVPGEAAIRVL